MKKGRIALAALALCALSAALIGQAAADTVRIGNLVITIEGGFSPTKLPKRAPAPISLNVKGSLGTEDGTHPPALRTLDLLFDKNGHLNTKGLATCTAGKLQSTLTAQAKKVCGAALVGSGKVSAEIALPEQPAFTGSGPLLIFNGAPKGGKQVLLFHVYAHVPAPTTFVTQALISRHAGKYGTEAQVGIPTIVGGQGSLTAFSATLRKTWTYKGQKQSLLLASCPTGSLSAHGVFTFADGTKAAGDVVRPCSGI